VNFERKKISGTTGEIHAKREQTEGYKKEESYPFLVIGKPEKICRRKGRLQLRPGVWKEN